jgi:hypothetical protein
MAHSEKKVNGKQLRSQRIIGLPFTVPCLPKALRSALTALRLGADYALRSQIYFCSIKLLFCYFFINVVSFQFETIIEWKGLFMERKQGRELER